jgi:hypothetical protein
MNEQNLKFAKAYFVSHNGLGDNITNIGAVNFLLKYYETIYFLCKDIHLKNVKDLFLNKSVNIIPFNSNNEFDEIKTILNNVIDDIFVSGCHTTYIKKKITHPDLLNYKQDDKNYNINFTHIYNFYYDIGLDLSIYYEYFDIESSKKSIKYYDKIKNKKIIFIHSKASNYEVNYDYVYEKYKDNKEYIIICANKNMYNENDEFYSLANKYVNINVALYIDIIKNSELYYVINSCFSCILLPLMNTNKILKEKVNLYVR